MELIENGFEVRSWFINTDINNLKNEIQALFNKFSDKVGDEALFDVFNKNPELFRNTARIAQNLITLHKFNVKLAEYTKFNALNTRPLLSFSHPGIAKHEHYWKVPAHQDYPSTLGSLDSLTIWMPLVDVDEEMGALQVVPGSHRWGLLPHIDEGTPIIEKPGDWNWQSVPMKIGQVLLMNSFLVHRSGNNTSGKVRWSAHFRYDNLNESNFIARGYPCNRVDKRI